MSAKDPGAGEPLPLAHAPEVSIVPREERLEVTACEERPEGDLVPEVMDRDVPGPVPAPGRAGKGARSPRP